jgi:hypothetical protein
MVLAALDPENPVSSPGSRQVLAVKWQVKNELSGTKEVAITIGLT